MTGAYRTFYLLPTDGPNITESRKQSLAAEDISPSVMGENTGHAMNKGLQPQDFGAVRFDLSKHKWLYRGEGNAHIAIYLPIERKVIRLQKCQKSEHVNDLNVWTKLQSNILFVSLVMTPLLGSMFTSPPTLTYLSSSDIEVLNESLLSVRPENRKHKVLSFYGGELHNDHAFFPSEMSALCKGRTICIELKPKQGMFPPSKRKSRNCSFCSKQLLKMKDFNISARSQYCPLELFSGYWTRMKGAVMSLFHSPQNNLRIFSDGQLIFGDGQLISDLQKLLDEWLHPISGSDLLDRFSSLTLKALLKNIDSESVESTNPPGTFVFDSLPHFDLEEGEPLDTEEVLSSSLSPCNFDKQDLPKGCILHRLAKGQALDLWGTSLVHDLLMKSEDYATVEEGNAGGFATNCMQYVNNIVQKGCCSKLNPIELYLIAAAVRDCSVLICLQEMKETKIGASGYPQIEDECSKTKYICKISVVDIGPKPISCIDSHMKKNVLILEASREAAAL